MRHIPVYVLIAVLAIVVVGLGLATAMVISSHGYFLDPDGRAHVQTLTGLNYGIVTPEPRQVQPTLRPVRKPTTTPHPVHIQPPCTTTVCVIYTTFCNGSTSACLRGQQAQRVATCMSNLMPGVTNTQGGMGLFGLRASTWAASPEASQSPFNALANAKAALWLYQQSGSWVRWGTCAPYL